MEMCRVCLTTEKEMIALDESFINYYNSLTNLNIALLDGMPQLICQTCSDTVKYFIEFREKCIASETTLREIVCEDVKSEDNVLVEVQNAPINYNNDLKAIKLEVKEEDSNLMDDFDASYDTYEEDLNALLVERYAVGPKSKKKILKRGSKPGIKTEKLLNNINDNETQWCCGVCPKKFNDKTELRDHLDNHKNDRQCGLCGEVFNSFSQFLAHRLMHIPIHQYKCHICAKRYRACLYLEHHYRISHIKEDSPYLSCRYCSVTCDKPKKMNNHMQMHSGVKYICDICSRRFQTKSNLKSHIRFHSDSKTYVCDMCGFSCKHSGGLKDHKVRKHSIKKVYCNNCKRPFQTQEAHDMHKCKKVERICPICGLRVSGSSKLSRHMRVHSDVPRYECTRCPAKFRSRGALVVHLDRHDGNKTKQCEFCQAKFYSASVLIKHRRIHTGEKPYVCKVCNKGFTGNNNLKVHMKVHGEYLIVKKNGEKEEITSVTD